MRNDFQAQILRVLALAVVRADQALERLGQADKTDGKRAVLEHFAHFVVPGELFAIQPHAFAHQEGVIVDVLARLNFKSIKQLIDHESDQTIQLGKELIDVVIRFDGDARQIDGGKAQIAAAIGDFAGFVVYVADHARAAAHVGDFGFWMALFVVLQVIGRVLEREIGE